MSFASLADNEAISFTDMSTSAFTPIGTPPTGNECMSKSDMETYYDVSSANLSGLASNELVTKFDLLPTGMYAYLISDPYYPSGGSGSCNESPGILCDNPGIYIVYATASNANSLTGNILFTNDRGLVDNFRINGPGYGCYYAIRTTSSGTKTGGTVPDGVKLIEVNSSGVVLNVSNCF